MLQIQRYSAKTHQGPQFNYNEDGLDVDLTNGLLLLLDGLGGPQIGDAFVLQTMEHIKHYFLHLVDDSENTLPFYYNSQLNLPTNAMINAIKRIHQESYKQNKVRKSHHRAAASIISACFQDNKCSVFSLGNCMGYLYRMGQLCPLFSENNYRYFNMDINSKILRNVPNNALGLFEEFNFELRELQLYPRDKLLFLSDGIYSTLNLGELTTIIEQKYENFNQLMDNLFEYANSKGNIDNQSAIIIEL